MSSERAIIHVDMDAFFASVEIADDPTLKGKPVIVGAAGNRGVVCAASYEAREFGIHAAQSIIEARRLCPQGIFLPVRMARYQERSREVFKCFHDITPHVEGLSVDEAFLDVTGCTRLYGDIEQTGQHIKALILERTGLIASIGMAPNKYLAKIASDLDKPDGTFRIHADNIQAVLDPLPIRRVWGIGPKAEKKLNTFQIHTIKDLRLFDPDQMKRCLGNQSEHFYNLARGIDTREVGSTQAKDKSVGNEYTFGEDLQSLDAVHCEFLRLSEKVGTRLRKQNLKGRTITIKIKESNFKVHSRSHTLSTGSAETNILYNEAKRLFAEWLNTHPFSQIKGIRLLGISTSNFKKPQQLDLFQAAAEKPTHKLDNIVDTIRSRFGDEALKRAKLIRDKDKKIT